MIEEEGEIEKKTFRKNRLFVTCYYKIHSNRINAIDFIWNNLYMIRFDLDACDGCTPAGNK